MKFLIIALSILSITAFAAKDPFYGKMKVKNASVRDYDGKSIVLTGNLEKVLNNYRSHGDKLTVEFTVDQRRFKLTSKYMAQKLYNALHEYGVLVSPDVFEDNNDDLTKVGPFPCGEIIFGEGEQGFKNATTYYVQASGDGGFNTCSKTGGPGAWDYSVVVNYDKVTNVGTFTIESYEE